MNRIFSIFALVLSFCLVVPSAFADDALLAALQDAGVVLTEAQVAQVQAAGESDVADIIAGLVESSDDGVVIAKIITAAAKTFPSQAGAITSAAIAVLPSGAAVIAGAAVAGSPASAAAITTAAVTAAPTQSSAIVTAASAAAPAQATAIASAAQAALQSNNPQDDNGDTDPSPS
jgi:hypothetical protein